MTQRSNLTQNKIEAIRGRGAPPPSWEGRSYDEFAERLMQEIKAKVDAAVSAAQSLGTQAASALNSLHASASVSGSASNSVGYSYSNDTASPAPTITGI